MCSRSTRQSQWSLPTTPFHRGSAEPGYNLLTVVTQNAVLSGQDGGSSGNTSGQEATSRGETVTFTSDYATFPSVDNSFDLGLNTLSSPMTINGT